MKYRNLNPVQRKRLILALLAYLIVGGLVLAYFVAILSAEKTHARDGWNSYLYDHPDQAQTARELSADATRVTVGTYVENLRELNMKSSYYRVEFMVWFLWEGDPGIDPANNFRVYKGLVNKKVVLEESHDGNKHYQLVGMDASVSKSFETKRFPLESHQMRFYLESTAPIQEVVFVADMQNSGMNRNLEITGYEFMRHGVGEVTYIYDSTHGDPRIRGQEMSSEIVTAIEINRSNAGLYFKCFIALFGTITWSLIALFICTYHHVDPLGMIPGALFGTVSNIMVGASLLPDSLEMGLLEYVNMWGVITILGVTCAIININRVRNKMPDSPDFIKLFGRMLFYTIFIFAILGQIVLPISAYIQ